MLLTDTLVLLKTGQGISKQSVVIDLISSVPAISLHSII